MRLISLGAGAQSSAMLLMGLDGAFGARPDAAIFADTQCEPRYVYEWLSRLTAYVAPFPIYIATAGNLGGAYVGGRRRAAIPAFSTTEDGKPIMMSRFCSNSYKVEVIRRQARIICGPRAKAESWIGISTDEAHRGYKPSGRKWLMNRYPLLEAGLTRNDCIAFVLERMGQKPPKSACLFCPFHGDAQWVDLKLNHPADFAEAVKFDAAIRNLDGDRWNRPRFLHRSLKPLGQVDFMHENQGRMFQDGFGNDCEGICGT